MLVPAALLGFVMAVVLWLLLAQHRQNAAAKKRRPGARAGADERGERSPERARAAQRAAAGRGAPASAEPSPAPARAERSAAEGVAAQRTSARPAPAGKGAVRASGRSASPREDAERGAPSDAADSAALPARSAASGKGVAGRISYMSPIDFSTLIPAPGDVADPHELPVSQHAIDEVLVKAGQVSVHMRARQAILRGLSDSSLGPREITDLVVSDPALAAQVLKTVNSPYYGLRRQQGSVFRAVLFLGHVEVRSIVVRACLAESFGPAEGPLAELLERLWQHSFTVSRAAYVMAKALGIPNPDEVATAALLHDVGKLIGLNTWPDRALAIYQPLRLSDHELLATLEPDLGVGHARLGEEIARIWDLPPVTSVTIANHHAPLYRRPAQVAGNHRAITVVHIADLMTHLTECHLTGQEAPAAWLPVEGWLETLKLPGGLQALCTPRIVLALLPPHLVRGDVAEEEAAAAS